MSKMPNAGFEISHFKLGIGHLALGVGLIGLILGAVRLTGPDDLTDNEQLRTAAYVSDLLVNHHFICQRDEAGEITSKPPMHTWLSALCEAPLGHATSLALRIPALITTLVMGVVLMLFTARHLGNRVAWMTGLIYFISWSTVKQIGLARMDATFAVFVGLGTLAAYRGWTTGRGWIWFWLAAVAATLCKGPLGLLLPAVGLLSALYLRGQSGTKQNAVLVNVIGAMLFLILTVGWFGLAIKSMGWDVFDKLINKELLAQSLRPRNGIFPGTRLWEPPLLVLRGFIPFSFFTFLGLYRYITHPSADLPSYRLESFLFWSLIGGMLIIGIGSHQRGDLLLPLYPAAAVIAAREIAHLTKAWQPRTMALLATLAAVLAITGYFFLYHIAARHKDAVQLTAANHAFADQLLTKVGPGFPFTHCDDMFAVNFYLHTMHPLHVGPTQFTNGFNDTGREVTYDYDACARLLLGSADAFVIVQNADKLLSWLPHDCVVYDLTPAGDAAQSKLRPHVISNCPTLNPTSHMILGDGPLTIETRDLTWISASANRFEFSGGGTAVFTNNGPSIATIISSTNGHTKKLVLEPGESRS